MPRPRYGVARSSGGDVLLKPRLHRSRHRAAPDPEVLPAAYVKELREEAAQYRVAAKKSEELTTRLVVALGAQTGRLADASDLPVTDDLLDDDGMPDVEKVSAAVDDLLTRKPHLASTRVGGDIGQGVRGGVEPMVSLADLLRSGAG